MKPAPAILLMIALLMAGGLPLAQGVINDWRSESAFYGYKTDVSVPPLPGAEIPEGGINLVFFGYRSCGTVCPLQLLNLKALHERWQDEPVQFVFVTLDPENDSQQSLNETVAALGQNFRAVRPETFRQAQSLADDYGGFAAREGGGSREINHGARIYAITADHRRQLLYASPDLDLERVSADITRLLTNVQG